MSTFFVYVCVVVVIVVFVVVVVVVVVVVIVNTIYVMIHIYCTERDGERVGERGECSLDYFELSLANTS